MHDFHKKISIVLVDDDSDDRQIFDEALSEIISEYELKSFADGRLFISHLTEENNQNPLPDIVFLDINMPIVDGLETLEIIRTQLHINEVPVIMYSTSCIDSDVEKAFNAGANAYLTKPTNFKKLKSVLRKVIETNFSQVEINAANFLVTE